MEKSKAEKRIRKALGLMPSTTFIKGKEGRKGGRKGRKKGREGDSITIKKISHSLAIYMEESQRNKMTTLFKLIFWDQACTIKQ
jgi:hypothetical protein